MKPGDLVRNILRSRDKDLTGIVLTSPGTHGYDGRRGVLFKVLWADGTQAVDHINNVEVISDREDQTHTL